MIYVISDLHGYPLENFQDLLEKAGFSDNDYCFILGDVIDRGEDGVQLLEWLMYQPNIQLLLGNHEAMLLSCDFLFEQIDEKTVSKLSCEQLACLEEWKNNGAEPTLRGLLSLDPDARCDILEYLRESPFYEKVEVGGREFILTHSGINNFSSEKDVSEYHPDDLIWNRPEITDTYWSDKTVIFGHTPTHYYGKEHKGRILVTDTWIDIDTGAACGLSPTLLRLDDMKTFSL
jgi:serine/threonine protein phosphatase 1